MNINHTNEIPRNLLIKSDTRPTATLSPISTTISCEHIPDMPPRHCDCLEQKFARNSHIIPNQQVPSGAVMIAQSGGPTAVINASAYGVIKSALGCEEVTRVLWAANGIKGILDDKIYDISAEDPAELALLMQTPAAAFGSCRKKIKEQSDFRKVLEIFKKYNVRFFFYIGGNDSMDTCEKISDFMRDSDYGVRIIGIPKTIDNDLEGTDHCPGFGSAAKYVATTCMELSREAGVYDSGQVIVLEIMGRNAGWLTAASALATKQGAGPDLIYLPEVAFSPENFFVAVAALHEKKKDILITVSEGIKDENGKYISEYTNFFTDIPKDSFGHTQLGGLAYHLAKELKNRLNTKVRGIELNLLQRCAAHTASKTDIDEAFRAGVFAFESALRGESGKMVAYDCKRAREGEGGYTCDTVCVPLSVVANQEKKVPLEWITKDKNFVTDELIDYVSPLIQGEPEIVRENSLPRFARLKKILINQ